MFRYGAAYYTEYLPAGREDTDMEMMKRAGMNTIRIAESTWATYEPREGEFDFFDVVRVLEKATQHGLEVIVGTPTYAVPAWLALKHPTVLAQTQSGRRPYGARQIMDITDEAYLYYAERIIRRLMETVAPYACVVGVQLDNETKHYDVCSENVQKRFVAQLRARFGTVDALNDAFGLNYWSNRIGSWEEFPDVRGTINASLRCAFEEFRRGLVTEFLAWQEGIVREYLHDGQLITHNLDFDWRGHSYGVQSAVNHNDVARHLTIAGCDIYHPSQCELTGREIAFAGDMTRGLKNAPYLVIETEAQGFAQWTPYPGQLKLQALSHMANGAAGVMYWHWHSLHNALETYWKGVLSHDLRPNRVYAEACETGALLKTLWKKVEGARKNNRAAILVSNTAQAAFDSFPLADEVRYNDVFRAVYDACYDMNLETDVVFPEADFARYDLLIVPALYAADDALMQRLCAFVREGGTLLCTFRTGFADENNKVRTAVQPAFVQELLGASYDRIADTKQTTLSGGSALRGMIELLEPRDCEVLDTYAGATGWAGIPAIVRRERVFYMGCLPEKAAVQCVLEKACTAARIPLNENRFPVIVRRLEKAGSRFAFVLNYSAQPQMALLEDGRTVPLAAWSGQCVEL